MSSVQSTTHRRWIFLMLLAALHLVFALEPSSVIGRWLFISHIGLGLLWQPFVQPRRRFGPGATLVIVLSTAFLAFFLDWAILLIWTMLLAGVVGGKVFMFPDRWERVFHLAALGYLVTVVLALIMPSALVALSLGKPELSREVLYLAPLILVFMALLPVKQGLAEARAEIVDFVYGMFVFLLLAVIVLGSLSYSLVFKSGILESQLITLAFIAGVLLLLGFIWNPRAGFAGLGTAVAQHVMSLGLPVEEWLQSLAELGKNEKDPDRFLSLACAELPKRLPGVRGGRWEGIGAQEVFGEQRGSTTTFTHGRLRVDLVTRFEPSPALRWHYDLVVRLLSEFYLGKWRAQELQRLSYIQAIYETGARLTHDVKNLLQSLDTLCAVANEASAAPSPRFGELLRRQLPEISARLRQTLEKLVEPSKRVPAEPLPAADWLASLDKRYGDADTQVIATGDLMSSWVDDPVLFSSVAENLLQNIATKRRTQSGIRGAMRLVCAQGATLLEVSDDGRAIPAALASRLLNERVPSEDGLGIGLYQCARQAEEAGYRLTLADNVDGCVRFRLARPDTVGADSVHFVS